MSDRGRSTRRRVGVAVAALLLIALGALLALRAMSRSLEGPRPALCALPPPPRGRFERPRQLTSASTPGARRYDIEPSAAVLADGALAVVFNPRDPIWQGTSGLSTAVVELDGGVEVTPYPTTRAEAFDAWMTATPDGGAAMVWLAHDGSSPERNMLIALSTSPDGRRWSSPPVAAQAPADCPDGARGCLDKPMVAATASELLVVYFSEVAQGLRLVRGPHGAFAPRASTAAGEDAYGGLFVAPSGAVHLAFGAGEDVDRWGDSRAEIRWRQLGPADADARTSTVSGPGEPVPFYFSNPRVVADEAGGLVYVVYPRGGPDGQWDIILATSADRGATWRRTRVNDDAPCATHMTPHLALDPLTRRVHVSWLDARDGQGSLAWAVCEPGGESCSANERISDAPFAKFTFERHLPAWLSEYGALEIDAERRVLHAVWTQPVLEDGVPTSRIFHARAPLD